MPVRRKKDSKGVYYQWGSGAKYYVKDHPNARARALAAAQGQAAYAHGYRKKK
jgi:hypothetical protein